MVPFPSPLIPGRLIQRYKRFLADVAIDGEDAPVTVHCPNPGAMLGLKAPGSRVWLSRSVNPKRKLALTLELIEADGTLVGLNTGLPNRLAEAAVAAGLVPALAGLGPARREVRYQEKSRVDLLYEDRDGRPVYVEVKNVHLMRQPGLAEFPDCVTTRGARHLLDLAAEVEAGARAVMLYVVQRADCARLAFAADLDPAYAAGFAEARRRGVEACAVRCDITLSGIVPSILLPIVETERP
ncbi:DNA/RNA nuclease SfsA [Aurantimonas sp. 22II-16-19i]|uniref:DNA/RNA nuclease SfsA n=1 Tax=Aurantimonas sp. 22II-16-19i TaxID=1317114 RepID=UPI0009F7D50C|nr:DNA/RNA nuclease SfsA [Aurantimonas sp. 22II-16-19i]ORE98292.1 DNA-binding transcriptional regulator [Aurantimonas sp. 22II-16-19i]